MGDAKVVWLTEVASSRFHSDPFSGSPGCGQLAAVMVHFCQAHCPRAVLNAKPTRASEVGEISILLRVDILVWEKSRIHRNEDVRSAESKTKDMESRGGQLLRVGSGQPREDKQRQ